MRARLPLLYSLLAFAILMGSSKSGSTGQESHTP
jgi:hypothetical protein